MSELGQQLIEIIRRKAAQEPFRVYEPMRNWRFDTCQYMHGDSPGCIIGHALYEAGIIDESLPLDPDGYNAKVFSQLAELLELPLDGGELGWLSAVQAWQDAQKTWGEAVQYADGKDCVLV